MLDTPETGRRGVPALTDELAGRLAARIAAKRPRVHCLTNSVAQVISANALVALGAEPSMASHPAEIIAMAGQADALLINLGTLDPQREVAITTLLDARAGLAGPLVLDPVMIDLSSFRRQLAMRLLETPRLIVKGNVREMALLGPALPRDTVRVTTGSVDHITCCDVVHEIPGGHPLMARFSGSGCLAGAVIAAFAAVETDLTLASAAAMLFLRRAAERAGARAEGPGTFVPHLIDALGRGLDSANDRARSVDF